MDTTIDFKTIEYRAEKFYMLFAVTKPLTYKRQHVGLRWCARYLYVHYRAIMMVDTVKWHEDLAPPEVPAFIHYRTPPPRFGRRQTIRWVMITCRAFKNVYDIKHFRALFNATQPIITFPVLSPLTRY